MVVCKTWAGLIGLGSNLGSILGWARIEIGASKGKG